MSANIVSDIHDHGFHIIDNFLDPLIFQQLRKTAELRYSCGEFKHAKIGHQFDAVHDKEVRNDTICWLNEHSQNKALISYFAKINELIKTLNRSLYLGLADFETHFAIYKPGSFYKKHVDQFNNTKDRRISSVYYLNSSWHESFGGELKLYDTKDKLVSTVLPQGNRLVCFNSDLPHEVCETKKTRYSIAGWMKTRSMVLVE